MLSRIVGMIVIRIVKTLSHRIIFLLFQEEKNRQIQIVYDKQKYKFIGVIERFFGKIKENRCLALRYEKDDSSFLSFFALAAIQLNLC